jgi:hypothetical protein
MARQRTNSQNLKSIVGAAVIGLGLVILLVNLDGPATELTSFLGAAARGSLELLPCLVPAAWHALQVFAFDHFRVSPCPFEALLSCGQSLMAMAGAI